MIAWKLVKERDRTSAYITYSSPYTLTYRKGTVVKAPKETLGIFCFTSVGSARIFASKDAIPKKIIKVEGRRKKRTPKLIAAVWDIEEFYFEKISKYELQPTPLNTILFDEVEVLT